LTDFGTLEPLCQKAGIPPLINPALVLKELVGNALDSGADTEHEINASQELLESTTNGVSPKSERLPGHNRISSICQFGQVTAKTLWYWAGGTA
jgi:hypothetical protein